MQTMTQGTERISMAHRAALGCLAVARRLPVVVVVVSIVALVAGTAGTSYAKKKKVTPEDRQTEDTVVVTNFGSLFAGTVETFAAGSILTSGPSRLIKGPATLLGAGNGASGDAQSSKDGDIAVTVPFGVPGLCPAGCVFVWPAAASGNAGPEEIIGGPAGSTPGGPLGIPVLNNNTGLFLDQGVAYDNPFRERGVHNTKTTPSQSISSTDRFAVANFGAVVLFSFDDFEECDGDIGAEGEPGEEDGPTVGTITFYQGEQTGNVFPTPDFLTLEIPFPPAAPNPFWSHSSIGGCDTALAGPLGLVFDTFGNLWVVNELGKFVTEYPADTFGDVAPINIIGLLGGTAGAFVDPAYIAVGVNPFDTSGDEVIYVTDVGDNSIKVFDVDSLFGVQLGTIKGGHTKLVRPEGIFLSGDDLYVVNNNANSLLMFDDLATSGLGNIHPKMMIKGPASKMYFPVGVAGPQFRPL
jgi:hypothetical protein